MKATRIIGKGGYIESLVRGILDDLQVLVIRFLEVIIPRGKDQLVMAIKKVTKIEPSLTNSFEQMPVYNYYSSSN